MAFIAFDPPHPASNAAVQMVNAKRLKLQLLTCFAPFGDATSFERRAARLRAAQPTTRALCAMDMLTPCESRRGGDT
jgi:hypothetical protein